MNLLEVKTQLSIRETLIERGMKTFVEVGNALAEIRSDKLYRASHKTFEDYCQERWGWSRQRASHLIQAAEVTTELSTVVDKTPANEGQARAVGKAKPEDRAEVWREARADAESEGRPVTAKHVEAVVKRRSEPVSAEVVEPKPKNGRPKVDRIAFGKARSAFGQFVRALRDSRHPAANDMQPHIDAIADHLEANR